MYSLVEWRKAQSMKKVDGLNKKKGNDIFYINFK